MIPRTNQWRAWSPLEKATYVAQVAAALALLPTVVFSWLSLREARLAREDQARYFQAEKAPILELQSIETRDGMLIGTARNVGDSRANSVSFWYTISTPPKECDITVSVNEQETRLPIVERGQTAEFIIARSTDFSEKCGMTPKQFKLRLGRSYSRSDQPPSLDILLVWRDVNGKELAKKYEAEITQ